MAPKLMKDVHTVGELIRRVREERDLTQTDVARIIGASQSRVAKWEANAHQMKFTDAVTFADALNVPLEWLVEAAKREKASTPKSESRVARPEGFEPPTFWSVVDELSLAEQVNAIFDSLYADAIRCYG